MQELTLAFARVTRAVAAANPELKHQVGEFLNRAYHNLYGKALTTADASWAAAMQGAALQLCLDARVHSLSPRELVQLLENMIRISEAHQQESRRHAAMASNAFYLKETALDAVLRDADAADYNRAGTMVVSIHSSLSGRVESTAREDSFDS